MTIIKSVLHENLLNKNKFITLTIYIGILSIIPFLMTFINRGLFIPMILISLIMGLIKYYNTVISLVRPNYITTKIDYLNIFYIILILLIFSTSLFQVPIFLNPLLIILTVSYMLAAESKKHIIFSIFKAIKIIFKNYKRLFIEACFYNIFLVVIVYFVSINIFYPIGAIIYYLLTTIILLYLVTSSSLTISKH